MTTWMAGHQRVYARLRGSMPVRDGVSRASRALINHHAADALALVHQVEALVDVGERHRVGDHWIDLDLAVHVPVDDLRDVGAASRAAERRALPHAAGDELEGARGDLRAGRRNPDDDRLAPAAMARFQGLAHHRHIAGAVEGVVRTADLVGALFG